MAKGQLAGKTAIITGASQGMGEATARLFKEEGAKVALGDVNVDKGRAVSKSLGRNSFFRKMDVSKERDWLAMVNDVMKRWGKIDILINNAGLALGKDVINKGKIEHWETMIDTNIKGLLFMTRAISPNMVKRKKGHIINVCSTAGKEVYTNGNVYCATKHAVDALTKAMRLDLYTHNIRVGQVSPAMVESTEFAKVRFEGDKNKANIYSDFNPLTSADVAESIYFMATRPAHINIQDIVLLGTQQANSTNVNRNGRIFDKE